MAVEEELRLLAARQHGLVTSEQARGLGATRNELRSLADQRRWERLTPSILRLRGSSATDDQAMLAAVLDAGQGACVSHQRAAAVWGLPGYPLGQVQVSRPRDANGRPARLAILHRPRSLPPHHVAMLRGIPVTNPTRTLFDLAADVSPGKLERSLDTAWSRRLVSGRTLHEMLHELAERGRTGISVMRQLLKERPLDYTPMDSGTEVRAKQVLRDAGIRGFDHQVDLGDDEEWLGRVDLVHVRKRVVIEIDSELYHGALLDQRADERRTRRLEDLGFVVRRATDTMVWHEPREFVLIVRRACRLAERNRSHNLASGSR